MIKLKEGSRQLCVELSYTLICSVFILSLILVVSGLF